MFDASNFDKLSDEFERMSDKFEKRLINSFESLPRKIRDAFKHGGELDDFTSGFDNLGDSVTDVEESISKLNKQMDFISGQKNKLNDFINKIKERRKEDNLTLLEIIKQAKSTDDLIDAEEYRLEVLDKWKEKLAELTKQQNLLNEAFGVGAKKAKGLDEAANLAYKKQGHDKHLQWMWGRTHDESMAKLSRQFNTFLLGDLFVKGIQAIIRAIETGYTNLRNSGMSAGQAIGNFGSLAGSTISGFRHGVITSPANFAAVMGGLSNNLGTTNVPNDLTIEGTRLSRQYKLSPEQSSKLLGNFFRMSNYSTKTATNMLAIGRNIASTNHFPIGTAMKDMADNSEIFATYAKRGIEAFERGDITIRRMGTSMQSINGIADKLVDDFDGSLQMQAQLQTVLPGLDMSQVMYASQFGTEEDVAKSLKAALQGSGLSDMGSMPRSIRNMISRQLGIPMDQLQNIISKGAPVDNIKGASPDYKDTTTSFINSFGDLTAAAFKAAAGLNATAFAAVVYAKTLGMGGAGGGIRSLFGGGAGAGSKLGMGIGIGSLLSGGFDAWNQHSQGRGMSDSLIHGALVGSMTGLGAALGSLIPVVGTSFGAIGGGMLGNWLGGHAANSLMPGEYHHSGGIAGLFHALDHLQDNEVPAVLQKGERVLTVPQTNNLSKFVSAAMNIQKANENIAQNALSSVTTKPDTGKSGNSDKIEDILNQILKATRDGHVLQMDGRKVGDTILNANRGR